jgi:archaeal type IV pilus assembly protein PilA
MCNKKYTLSCPSRALKRCFEIMVTRKNDEAVSPVIGVILMVAITVILAAVIAAFVFGMSGNISKTKTVAVTAQKLDGQHISVMNQGGQDQSAMVALNVTTNPGVATMCKIPTDTTYATSPIVAGTCQLNPAPVGAAVGVEAATAGDYNQRTEVVVVGNFNDGTTQVLLDTFI